MIGKKKLFNYGQQNFKIYQKYVMFAEDSDVAQLEILQQLLIDLDERNFSEAKDWILQSTFTRSEEGIHDLIYTFYLISAARAHENKSTIFSRMITSLYELRATNEILNQIPNQALELIMCTKNMDTTDIANQLIENSIIDKLKYEIITSRKKADYDLNYLVNDHIMQLINNRTTYVNFSENEIKEDDIWRDKEQDIAVAISNDDIDSLQELLSEEVEFNFDFKSTLSFRDTDYEFSMIDYAAFKGSIKCFKYLFLNDTEISKNTIDCAFYNGNTEIIHILEEEHNLERGLVNASACFHNDIFDWLVETKGYDINILKSTENVHVLRYLIEKGVKLNMTVYNTQSIILTKFFHENFVGNDHCLATFKKPYAIAFFNACMNGNVGLVRFLIKNYRRHIKHYQRDINPFHIAILENHPEVVELFKNLKGISLNSSHDLFKIAISNKLYEILSHIVEISCIEFSSDACLEAINSNDAKILSILWPHEHIRDYFDFKSCFLICIEDELYNSFKFLLDHDTELSCSKVLYKENYIDAGSFICILLEKIDSPEFNFQSINHKKWKNIDDFEIWWLVKGSKYHNIDLVRHLLLERKVKVDKELFFSIISKWIAQDFHSIIQSYNVIDMIVDKFPGLLKQNEDEILRYCREQKTMNFIYASHERYFNRLTKEEIFELLLYSCETLNYEIIDKYQNILPEYINMEIKGDTLLSIVLKTGGYEKSLLNMLVNVPNINLNRSLYKDLLFESYGTIVFDKLSELPGVDFNCQGLMYEEKTRLIYKVAVNNDIKNFVKILKRENIKVNEPIMIKQCYTRESKFENYLIHYLIEENKKEMLKALLSYPTIEVNSKDKNGITPLVLAIRLRRIKAVKLLLNHPKVYVNLFCGYYFTTCPLLESLKSDLRILIWIVEREDINLSILEINKTIIQNYLDNNDISSRNLRFLRESMKTKAYFFFLKYS